jgi:predicted enzyme related to lactoylglutathione lyase
MAEWFARPGVVLFTENYEACCAFYRDVLQLPIEQVTPHLVRFGWGAAYLMVERGGVANLAGKPASEGPVLRFNVDDMEATAALLRSRGVAVMVNVLTGARPAISSTRMVIAANYGTAWGCRPSPGASRHPLPQAGGEEPWRCPHTNSRLFIPSPACGRGWPGRAGRGAYFSSRPIAGKL